MIQGTEETGTWTEEMVTFPARHLVEQDQIVRGLMSILASIEASTDVPAMHRNARRAAQNARALLGGQEP